jgi:hypothetical protein
MEKIKIQRYIISELIKDNQITGIKYDLSDDGNWVLYSDVKNILEDQSIALHKIDYILKKISDHRDNKNGL